VRAAVWAAWKKAPHPRRASGFQANRVRFDKHESPYVVRTVGERPANGWPLFIAMHGGGGAPKEVNDSQWQGMQRHYKDHPELGGYKYLALRAPNDTWNGFYDDYVYPLIGNLTANFNLFGDIDPNKVFALGYSHGGYGAYAIGPKMPDHFAAVHSSAAAATDGETSAKTLRSTVFTAMVGERDLAYDRLSRNQKFAALIETLRGDRKDIYPVRVDVALGFEHGNLNDRDKIAEMYPHTRNPIPRELSWEQTDGVVRDFFWLASENPAKAREVSASRDGNRITVTTKNGAAGWVLLDARMVDFSRPVEVERNGHLSRHRVHPSLKTLCETVERRGDPELAFSARLPFGG
jgi:predicted esterase